MAVLACQARLPALSAARSVSLTQVRHHLGYLPFEGRLGRYPTYQTKFSEEVRRVNLQPVDKITYTFDPLTSEYFSLRNVMFFLSTKKVKATNVKTIYKTNILDDRSPPNVKFDLNDGRQLEIRTGNLTDLEIVSTVNNYVLPLVKEVEEVVVETKAAKGAGAGGKGKGKK